MHVIKNPRSLSTIVILVVTIFLPPITLLLGEDLLLPLETRGSLDDGVEEGHLRRTHTSGSDARAHFTFKHATDVPEPFKCDESKRRFPAQVLLAGRCACTPFNVCVSINSISKDRFYGCIQLLSVFL